MAFDAAGEKCSDRVFCEGRAELNSGELVVKATGADDLVRRAAEATETVEADAEGEAAAPAGDAAPAAGESGGESF